ncbi:MAG: GNAT family N-acetyltransferase [Bacteroidota bacterium]
MKRVTLSDLHTLVTLAQDTFVDAFGAVNKKEDMQAYLESSLSRQQLQQELLNEDSEFYFGLMEGTVAGYLKFNVGNAQNEPLGDSALELERIYVRSQYQGQGLGKQLLDFTLEEARRLGKETVWLGVWDQNHGARRLYESRGFTAFGSHDFWLGSDLQTDILMRLPLNKTG